MSIPRPIWALGLVSLFMDISSEMIHALLPMYMVGVLGISVGAVGLIEGIAEATSMIVKVFSGALSDRIGHRKLLTTIGYALAAFTKPVFPLATGLSAIMAARFIDRIGKGIRGAPRDALVADLAPEHLRGASFGLRQSLDTVGAFVGPLLAVGLMLVTANNFKLVFWVAVIPAFIALALMVFAVKEPERASTPVDAKKRLQFSDVRQLPTAYWTVVGVAAVFTLARFSEAFLILKAQSAGVPIALVPMIMVLMNVVYAVMSYPVGVLSDRIGRTGILLSGIAMLIVADVILAFSSGVFGVLAGVVFWGLHMGLTQGLLATIVADTAPENLRGTAFGIFYLACGVAMLLASVIAGALWDAFGPQVTFLTGAGITTIALIGLVVLLGKGTSRMSI
jgi:MFS family permease